MPSTVGIVASGEDVLNDAVFWVDAGLSSVVSGALTNLGTGGSALNAQFGSTSGTDSFDPQLLTHTGTNYLHIPATTNNYASVPDIAAFAPTTSISYRFALSSPSWKPSTAFSIGGQYDSGSANRSNLCGIASGASGFPTMVLSSDGVVPVTITGDAAPTVSDGGLIALRYDWSSTPNVRFYSKPTTVATALADVRSDSGWTQLGTTKTTSVPASLFNATSVMALAGALNQVLGGTSHYASAVKVDGVEQVAADFTTGIISGAQITFTESSANAATVTINRATSGRKSVAVVRNVLSFGTDDYLEVADSDLLDFAASDSFTVMAVQRYWATATTARALVAKKADTTAATAGWALTTGTSTAAQVSAQVGDGTNGTTTNSGSRTAGTLQIATMVRNVTTDQITAYVNNTAGTAVIDTTTATSVNSEVMRIGRLSGVGTNYQDMELVAAAVWRRALNTNEIATIVARYT